MGNGRAYAPQRTPRFRTAVHAAWLAAGAPHLEGPIKATITLSTDSAEIVLEELEDRTPSKLRCDFDNYAKALLDGLNGCAYDDDRQVQILSADKT